jgi:hypothetical protein
MLIFLLSFFFGIKEALQTKSTHQFRLKGLNL